MKKTITHEPVMVNEVIEQLHIKNQGRYIDATLGAGGYTIEILKRGGEVLGIDADPKMLEIAKERIETACPGSFFKAVNGNFKDIAKIAKESGFGAVDGIVFDLGVSNIHFLGDDRGFSFQDKEVPLDMRLNPETQGVKAADLLNNLRSDQLEMMFDRGLAEKIIAKRQIKPFENVGDLVDLIGEQRFGKTHPATKAFLELRMAVNSELENLKEALPQALNLLKEGGMLEVVSFHSLEDRIVKEFMKSEGKLILPTREEIVRNPKSRSAKLRILTK